MTPLRRTHRATAGTPERNDPPAITSSGGLQWAGGEEVTGARLCTRGEVAPNEIAPFLVYLASSESDYMTGQMCMVDGGQVLV